MVIAQIKRLDICAKPGVILLRGGFGRWPSWRGWDLIQPNEFALPWDEVCCLLLLRFTLVARSRFWCSASSSSVGILLIYNLFIEL